MIHPGRYCSACLAAAAVSLAAAGQAGAATTKHRPTVQVELGLTAAAATWSPASGRLHVDDIAPRMTMMAVAPRKKVATVPASQLGENWRPLMGADRETNAIVSGIDDHGRRRLYPVRVRLVKHAVNGEEMTFVAKHLKHAGDSSTGLGSKPRELSDVTVLIDPTITDAIKAMWSRLLSFFGGENTPAIPAPASPVAGSGTNARFQNRGIYAGPADAPIGTNAQWQDVQRQNLDGAGGDWTGDLAQAAPDIQLTGAKYDGPAFFNHDYGTIAFEPAESVAISNLAVTGGRADALNLKNAEVGGADLSELRTTAFNVSNSVFDGVDLSGLAITPEGSNQGRSTVENSVFFNVSADSPAIIHGVDFESVSFQNADLKNSEIQTTTFQGCGLSNVDLSGSSISGPDPQGNDDTFQPTFDNSILDNVKLDNAKLENVSFAGVDFSDGNVSLDGVTLTNVDFTGAKGLQSIDWSNVNIDGNVYGLGEYGLQLNMIDRSFLRTWTTDGVVPQVDARTGYDVEPVSGYLVDPGSGVRFEEDVNSGALVPIDPATGQPLTDPRTGGELQFQDGELVNPTSGEHYQVDYMTGALEA